MLFIILQIDLQRMWVQPSLKKQRIIFPALMSLPIQELAYILQIVCQHSCCRGICFKQEGSLQKTHLLEIIGWLLPNFVYYNFLLSSPLQHVNKEPVNEIEELQLILSKAIKVLKSLFTVVHRHLPAPTTTEGTSFLGLRVCTCSVTSTTFLREKF